MNRFVFLQKKIRAMIVEVLILQTKKYSLFPLQISTQTWPGTSLILTDWESHYASYSWNSKSFYEHVDFWQWNAFFGRFAPARETQGRKAASQPQARFLGTSWFSRKFLKLISANFGDVLLTFHAKILWRIFKAKQINCHYKQLYLVWNS